MDENILKEYQKRVADIVNTLEQNENIVREGVVESQTRTDNRLTELQGALEEVETEMAVPVDMSDVGISSLGTFVRDTRVSTVRSSYANDREGYLLSEYDKRRIDPDEPNANVEKVVEQIRQEREAKRQAKRNAIVSEMQKVSEEQEKIASVREAQEAKSQVMEELQAEQDRIEKSIEEKSKGINSNIKKSTMIAREAVSYKEILAKHPNKKANSYVGTQRDFQKCKDRLTQANSRIESLDREIKALRQDLREVEALLKTLSQVREKDDFIKQKAEEIARQEDEMWKEYRAEQKEKDDKKEEEIEYGLWEHNYDEQLDERFNEENTKEEIKEYGHTGENSQPEPLPLGPYRVPLKEKIEGGKPPVPPTPGRKPTGIQIPNGPFKITKAGLTISDSGLPTYYVELTDTKGELVGPVNYEQNNGYYKVIVPGIEQEPELQQLQSQLIAHPKDYYDFGLAGLLKEVDEKYGTTGAKDYINMLKEKDKPADTREKAFDIDYNLSKLGNMSIDKENKTKARYLKKLARANSAVGLASYEKAPSIFSKISTFIKEIMSKVKTLRITAAKPIEQQPIVSQSEEQNAFKQRVAVKPQELSSTSKLHYISSRDNSLKIGDDGAAIIKAYLNDSEGKSVEQFIEAYQVEDELANMLRTTPREKLVITDKKCDMGKIAKKIATISTFITISRGAQEAVDNFIKNSVQDQELETILRTSSIEELREQVETLKERKNSLKDEIEKLQGEEMTK